MSDITYSDKSQIGAYDPAEWNAQDANEVKNAVNSKVDEVNGKQLSTEDYTSTEKTKLSGIEANATANDSNANLKNRANHTGTQNADTIVDGTTNKVYSLTEKTKLSGIATGATANATDAQLRDRSTHTGSQAISTVTNLQNTLDSKQTVLVSGVNIKTINSTSLLGSGDIVISGGGSITDGDKGDVTVASSGTVWTVPDLANKADLEGGVLSIDQIPNIPLENLPDAGLDEDQFQTKPGTTKLQIIPSLLGGTDLTTIDGYVIGVQKMLYLEIDGTFKWGEVPAGEPSIPLEQSVQTLSDATITGFTNTWTAVTNSVSYTWQVAKNSTFTSDLSTIYTGIALTETATGLDANTPYYSRIIANPGLGYSQSTSETETLSTLPNPEEIGIRLVQPLTENRMRYDSETYTISRAEEVDENTNTPYKTFGDYILDGEDGYIQGYLAVGAQFIALHDNVGPHGGPNPTYYIFHGGNGNIQYSAPGDLFHFIHFTNALVLARIEFIDDLVYFKVSEDDGATFPYSFNVPRIVSGSGRYYIQFYSGDSISSVVTDIRGSNLQNTL